MILRLQNLKIRDHSRILKHLISPAILWTSCTWAITFG